MIGIDIINISRIARLITLFPQRFPYRILSPLERTLMPPDTEKTAPWLAKRFAAKEAVSKLAGTGICSQLSWHDIQILNSPEGQPHISLSPQAFSFISHRLGFKPYLALSLSDDPPYAIAVAVAYPSEILSQQC